MRLLGYLALIGAALAAMTGAVLLFGGYDISATDPHLRPTVVLLDTAMRHSVRRRAAALEPPALEAPELVADGVAIYREHCELCHGGPGVAPAPFALGMVPSPANLTYTARQWQPADLFWVIKHGIKMTGMPAWAYRLSDREIWSVVAFLRKMAQLSPREYAALETPRQRADAASEPLVDGDAGRGERALHQYACPTCHEIPGVAASSAPVGPPLAGLARRGFIAGVLPNTHDNLVRWLRGPQAVDPLSAMPDLGLKPQDAADIAAFLMTLD